MYSHFRIYKYRYTDLNWNILITVLFFFFVGIGARHTLTILAAVGLFFSYALRFIMSIAIVAMTNSTTSDDNNKTIVGECPGFVNSSTSNSKVVKRHIYIEHVNSMDNGTEYFKIILYKRSENEPLILNKKNMTSGYNILVGSSIDKGTSI